MILPKFALFLIFLNYVNTFAEINYAEKKIFCYYFVGSAGRPGIGRVEVEDINENYCTYLIYGSIGIDDDGQIRSLNSKRDFKDIDGKDNIGRFNKKKQYVKNLKTLVAIGGWSSIEKTSQRYSQIFSDDKKRKAFVKNVSNFLTKFKFDGILLHWIYPGIWGGDPENDKFTLTNLLKELKSEFENKNFLLVLTGHGYTESIDISYNVKDVVEIVDYIILHSYDFYGATWNCPHIGIASALYLHPKERENKLSTDSIVNYWLARVTEKNSHKIVMGIPFFFRTFQLKDPSKTEPGSAFIGPGEITEYFREAGRMSYMELCQRILEKSWAVTWEPTQKNPYAFKEDQWVGFENERSLKFKAQYVLDKNLGGVSVFNVLNDDVKGICGEKYPLLKTLYNHLRAENVSQSRYVVKSDLCVYSDLNLAKIN